MRYSRSILAAAVNRSRSLYSPFNIATTQHARHALTGRHAAGPTGLRHFSSDEAQRNPELEAAVHTMLKELGEDPEREGLLKTPKR
eukprot:3799817-Rhodomonas_salina.2